MRNSTLPITINKSRYMAGVQCLKRLYLLVHQPDLGQGKTAADFALMDQGRQVGKLAQRLFPGGVEVRTGSPEEAIRITQELIANPAVVVATIRTAVAMTPAPMVSATLMWTSIPAFLTLPPAGDQIQTWTTR